MNECNTWPVYILLIYSCWFHTYVQTHTCSCVHRHTHIIQYDVTMHRCMRVHVCVITHTDIQDLSVSLQIGMFGKEYEAVNIMTIYFLPWWQCQFYLGTGAIKQLCLYVTMWHHMSVYSTELLDITAWCMAIQCELLDSWVLYLQTVSNKNMPATDIAWSTFIPITFDVLLSFEFSTTDWTYIPLSITVTKYKLKSIIWRCVPEFMTWFPSSVWCHWWTISEELVMEFKHITVNDSQFGNLVRRRGQFEYFFLGVWTYICICNNTVFKYYSPFSLFVLP